MLLLQNQTTSHNLWDYITVICLSGCAPSLCESFHGYSCVFSSPELSTGSGHTVRLRHDACLPLLCDSLMHIRDSGLKTQKAWTKGEKENTLELSQQYRFWLLWPLSRSNFLPPNPLTGFVTKSIHLLIISPHTHKMNKCMKFSKRVSRFLIEFIFPEQKNVFPSSAQTPGL